MTNTNDEQNQVDIKNKRTRRARNNRKKKYEADGKAHVHEQHEDDDEVANETQKRGPNRKQNFNKRPDSIISMKKFPGYFSQDKVEEGLKEGSLVKGAIRINPKNFQKAYVTNPSKQFPDILISGLRNRNRALDKDIVIVKIFEQKKDWKILHDAITEHLRRKGTNLDSNDLQLKLSAIGNIKKIGEENNSDEENEGDKNVVRTEKIRDEKVEKNFPGNISNSKEKEVSTTFLVEPISMKKFVTSFGQASSIVRGNVFQKKRVSPADSRHKEKKNVENLQENTVGVITPSRPQNLFKRPRQEKEPEPEIMYELEEVLKYPEWEKFLQPSGQVVFIWKQKHNRKAAGFLSLFKNSTNQNFAQFTSTDCRIPLLKIPRMECPDGFFARPEDSQNVLFIAEIKDWEFVATANGTILKNLEDGSKIEAQNESNLILKGIIDEEFSEEVMSCLPSEIFKIPDFEIEKRRDFRQECVFTIDPMTARDLDDALSVSEISPGRYRVTVHIADVSYFVKEESEVDKEAYRRGNSVYLVQKVVPMLPRTLCENLCSLNPDEDRLTFSVQWVIRGNGTIESTWFGKSIIRSCCKMAYEHAQSMLENPAKQWVEGKLPVVTAPWTPEELSTKVNLLQKISQILRDKREKGGALRLDLPKISFVLNKATGMPMGYQLYEHRHSNKLIEEFMVLANRSVAEKIAGHFPNLAVLRNHESPEIKKIEKVKATFDKLKIEVNFSSSKTLGDSLKALKDKTAQEEAKKHVIVNQVAYPMVRAEYICAGAEENVGHYALAVPMYTHFTSPIRRYPDLMVHRMLESALTGSIRLNKTWFNEETLKNRVEHLNETNWNAKEASKKSDSLYLGLYINQCGPINVKGVVKNVRKNVSMDVLIYPMASVKRVEFGSIRDDLEKAPRVYRNDGNPEIKVTWKEPKTIEHFRVFTQVDLTLHSCKNDNPFEFVAEINRTKYKPTVIRKEFIKKK